MEILVVDHVKNEFIERSVTWVFNDPKETASFTQICVSLFFLPWHCSLPLCYYAICGVKTWYFAWRPSWDLQISPLLWPDHGVESLFHGGVSFSGEALIVVLYECVCGRLHLGSLGLLPSDLSHNGQQFVFGLQRSSSSDFQHSFIGYFLSCILPCSMFFDISSGQFDDGDLRYCILH